MAKTTIRKRKSNVPLLAVSPTFTRHSITPSLLFVTNKVMPAWSSAGANGLKVRKSTLRRYASR